MDQKAKRFRGGTSSSTAAAVHHFCKHYMGFLGLVVSSSDGSGVDGSLTRREPKGRDAFAPASTRSLVAFGTRALAMTPGIMKALRWSSLAVNRV